MTNDEFQSNGAHPLPNGGGGEGGRLLPGNRCSSSPLQDHPLSHPLENPTMTTSDEFDISDLLVLTPAPSISFSPTSPSQPCDSEDLPESSSSDPVKDYIRISVSNPEKVPEYSNSIVPGSNSYYTYQITTTTNLPELVRRQSRCNFRVRRRFRDLVSLSDRLLDSYRGFFVPLRPDKSVIEGQVMDKAEFVEQRRAAIEKYLGKLAAHPVIRRGDELWAFLTADDGFFNLADEGDDQSVLSTEEDKVPPAPAPVPPGSKAYTVVAAVGGGAGRDWWKVFRELKQSVVNDWVGSKPVMVEEDKMFLDRKNKLEELQLHLSTISQKAESLVTAQQELAQTMGDLGMTFIKLAKLETHVPQALGATNIKNASTATIKGSRLYRSLNAQTVKHLDVLHDYLGMMLAVDNAFADRSSALLNIQSLESELASLQSKIEKLELASAKVFGGDKSSMLKIEELKRTLKTTEDSKLRAVRDYEQIKENNRSELNRLDKERRADFYSMLKGFAVSQAEYSEKLAGVWETLVEDTSKYSAACG